MPRHVALTLAAAALCGFALTARSAAAQTSFAKVEIRTTPLASGFSMLAGAGGNMTVSVGTDGVLLVDAEYAALHEKIRTAIAKLSGRPVRLLINTHWHPDHTDGDGTFAAEGTIIVAQENVYTRLSADQFVRHVNRTIPALPSAARPTVTYNDRATIHFNGQTVRLIHIPNAHTDGDTLVVFEPGNVLAMGDCFFAGQYPIIDVGTGGTVDGYIAAVEEGLKLAGEDTKIVPGHGPLATRADLAAFDQMLHEARDAVARLKAKGLSLAEVQAAKPTASLDGTWAKGFIKPDMFVEFIYNSLPKSLPAGRK